MTSDKPYVLSWGVIGSGWIATKFVTDLAIPSDEFTDVLHAVTAVGSRDKHRAEDFIQTNLPEGAVAQQKGLSPPPQAYGSYDEVYNHKEIDIIYIATLHPTHYNDAKAALEAGKHCLVEKPATLNAAEWKALSALAKEKNLFLMEGMWTRFLPIISKLKHALFEEKAIGEIRGVQAMFGMNHANTPSTHRLMAPSAAGGALMDLGVYAMFPALLALYHNPDNGESPPEQVHGTIIRAESGVDLTTSISMAFPKLKAFGVGTASFVMHSAQTHRCIISGTKGEIILHDYLSRLTQFTVRKVSNDGLMPEWHDDILVTAPPVGFGLIHEANEVARCLRDGLIESKTMPHAETTMVMQLIDLVRKQNGYEFQEGLEQIQ